MSASLLVGRIYRATIRQRLLSKTVINVFYAKVTDPAYTSTQLDGPQAANPDGNATMHHLAEGIMFRVWEPLLTVLTNQHSFVDATVELMDLDGISVVTGEVWSGATGFNGGRDSVSQPAPAFLAVNYRQVRATTAQRHGFKRLSGLTEAGISGDNVTQNEWVSSMANRMSGGFAIPRPAGSPGSSAINPADAVFVVRNTPRNNQEGDATFYEPTGSFATALTTQNTRKD